MKLSIKLNFPRVFYQLKILRGSLEEGIPEHVPIKVCRQAPLQPRWNFRYNAVDRFVIYWRKKSGLNAFWFYRFIALWWIAHPHLLSHLAAINRQALCQISFAKISSRISLFKIFSYESPFRSAFSIWALANGIEEIIPSDHRYFACRRGNNSMVLVLVLAQVV